MNALIEILSELQKSGMLSRALAVMIMAAARYIGLPITAEEAYQLAVGIQKDLATIIEIEEGKSR